MVTLRMIVVIHDLQRQGLLISENVDPVEFPNSIVQRGLFPNINLFSRTSTAKPFLPPTRDWNQALNPRTCRSTWVHGTTDPFIYAETWSLRVERPRSAWLCETTWHGRGLGARRPWQCWRTNSALFGTVSWNGALLGVTPSAETVAGRARLVVELSTFEGQLDLTGLERWGVKAAPGMVGTGITWGDGDLEYSIGIRGNSFHRMGGDDGQVAGAFFGAAHEAMGGALERSDLTAEFGGKR